MAEMEEAHTQKSTSRTGSAGKLASEKQSKAQEKPTAPEEPQLPEEVIQVPEESQANAQTPLTVIQQIKIYLII